MPGQLMTDGQPGTGTEVQQQRVCQNAQAAMGTEAELTAEAGLRAVTGLRAVAVLRAVTGLKGEQQELPEGEEAQQLSGQLLQLQCYCSGFLQPRTCNMSALTSSAEGPDTWTLAFNTAYKALQFGCSYSITVR